MQTQGQITESLCKIKSHNIGYGTGFLCIISFQQKNDLPVLITNNYILDNDDISKDKNIIFYLEDNKHKIKIDNSRKIYTNDNYNIIIIEIKKEDKLNIKSFFKIDDNIFRDNLDYLYYGHYVYLLYYGKDKKPRHSKGEIQNINIKNNTFEHLCQCEIETLGAPILDLSNDKVMKEIILIWVFSLKNRLKNIINYIFKIIIQNLQIVKVKKVKKVEKV